MVNRVVFFFILSCFFFEARATEPLLSLDKARDILRTTQPDRYALDSASVIKSDENLRKEQIYKEQCAAIMRFAIDVDSLGSDDLKSLIPYLGYGVNASSFMNSVRRENVEQLKKTFPVFGIILSSPKAEDTLSRYCLDSKNLMHDRVVSFEVLRYVDSKEFKKIAPLMNKSFLNPKIMDYLQGVENNQIPFSGDTPFFE